MSTQLTLQQLIALRAVAKRLPQIKQHKTLHQATGSELSLQIGRGMEFAEVRPYQMGDDVRHIHWRLTAKTNQPYSKLYLEQQERPLWLLVDQSETMQFATRGLFKNNIAAKITAILAWAAMAQHNKLGVIIADQKVATCFPVSKSRHHVMRILQHLVAAQTEATVDSADWLMLFKKHQQRFSAGSSIIVVSDFCSITPSLCRQLQQLARKHSIVLIHLYDPIEKQLPMNEQLPVVINGKLTTINTFNQKLCQQYEQQFDDRVTMLQRLAQQPTIGFVSIATNDDISQPLARVKW